MRMTEETVKTATVLDLVGAMAYCGLRIFGVQNGFKEMSRENALTEMAVVIPELLERKPEMQSILAEYQDIADKAEGYTPDALRESLRRCDHALLDAIGDSGLENLYVMQYALTRLGIDQAERGE